MHGRLDIALTEATQPPLTRHGRLIALSPPKPDLGEFMVVREHELRESLPMIRDGNKEIAAENLNTYRWRIRDLTSNPERQKFFSSRIREPWRPRFTLPVVPFPRTRRLLFYGFAVSDEWLQDLNLANFAIRVLVSQTGIRALTREWALPPKVLPPGVVTGPEDEVTVLAICASHEDSLVDRPSQEQVDKLQQIMGSRQAMWWVDHDSPETYE
ncbi:hypothetical protein BV25DRAFT_1992149 [Artomyces pyxidatus]|uniref:Uncharacterized protein n=1 Tax=Artomyces pyxidatus TaxID=48021 RepID=A0ACB8T022_9AGAM|nr:hypothetical protein BV25DRAFT_1992149 [Artomyces pyxidatus]